jgi:hypothetical protein
MRIPGFEAEACLSSTGTLKARSLQKRYYLTGSSVQPQLFSKCLLNCEQICEGDFIGACMPWCLCRCRGGKHCGVPS